MIYAYEHSARGVGNRGIRRMLFFPRVWNIAASGNHGHVRVCQFSVPGLGRLTGNGLPRHWPKAHKACHKMRSLGGEARQIALMSKGLGDHNAKGFCYFRCDSGVRRKVW